MAGTRLTVHLLFAVQLLLLVCVACYVGGIMGVTMNYKDRQRAGMDLLPTHLLDGSWLRKLPPFHLDEPVPSKSDHDSQSTASLYELQSARRQWQRPHVMVTLVDEDPTSYMYHQHDYYSHHAHLSQALTETLDQTLGPMLHQRLSPLFGNGNSSRRLSVQTVLHQGSLSSMSMTPQPPKQHDPNRKNETTAAPYFLELDDDFGERFWNHHNHLLETPGLPRRNSNIIHFVVYVPPKNRRPMLVRHERHDDDASQKYGTPTVIGTSFTLPSFFVGAVSIVNLPDIVATDIDDDSLNVPQHYRLAVQQAVSHFGTALRQYMGLRSTTTTTTTRQKEDADDPTHQFLGCSDAELKELCRSSWNIQYPIAFANIQTQLDRILRPYQRLSEWIQEYNIPILGSSSLLLLYPTQEQQHWLGKRVFRWLLLQCSRLWADNWSGPPLSMHAAQLLLDSVSYLEQSHRNAKEGQFENAMEDLQRCHERIEAYFRETTDSTMTMPSNFSWEQHMAIFSPLLLPLVLPMVIGLMRELKRYKQLIMAANEIKLQS
eukprot:scaffold4515_cov42-Attheya_sp.AAC.2